MRLAEPAHERARGILLRAVQNVYDAVVTEALKRLDLMRACAAWKGARAMPKGKAKSGAFERVRAEFGFTKLP